MVVEVLEPGPLAGKVGQWESIKRERAEEEVKEALAYWQSMTKAKEK